jgi:hypothetical protein
MIDLILLKRNLVSINITPYSLKPNFNVHAATIVANMAYYGYAPSKTLLDILNTASLLDLTTFWSRIEPTFKTITGADKGMGDHVVYKNFPTEVLEKSEAEYWFAQIFMYLGADKEYFTQPVKERPELNERLELRIINIADDNSLQSIFDSLVNAKSTWSDHQKESANYLVKYLNSKQLDIDDFGFKTNGVDLAKDCFEKGIPFTASNATDVLRIASALSGSDSSLRGKIIFRNFKRSERRLLLSALESSKNLEDDMSMRKQLWKRFMKTLHPSDFKFQRVINAYDLLYRGELKSFDAKVEALILEATNVLGNTTNITSADFKASKKKDSKLLSEQDFSYRPFANALEGITIESVIQKPLKNRNIGEVSKDLFALVTSRPAIFVRKFHKLYSLLPKEAAFEITFVIPQLDTTVMLKFKRYIKTINNRKGLIYPPRGNWSHAHFVKNEKCKIEDSHIDTIVSVIDIELANRVKKVINSGVILDPRTDQVKLKSNDDELAEYGRGTSFNIPEEINFIRTASYWQTEFDGDGEYNVWFDNGWNFFDKNWKGKFTCCWLSNANDREDAVFSGDPCSSKTADGKACQLIDLYLDKLIANGVRYAVWNVLCYSKIPFEDAKDVFASLQWGSNPLEGELFEPSRAQLSFPLRGSSYAKYVAYIDLFERKLVLMDANLSANTSSAHDNISTLEDAMPSFVEYLETLPSVHDIFESVPSGDFNVAYDDRGIDINGEAYVFKSLNPKNKFVKLDLGLI